MPENLPGHRLGGWTIAQNIMIVLGSIINIIGRDLDEH